MKYYGQQCYEEGYAEGIEKGIEKGIAIERSRVQKILSEFTQDQTIMNRILDDSDRSRSCATKA